jgi:hypothetical protein
MTDRDHASPRSPLATWVLCLAAIPVLYVLSLPPIFYLTVEEGVSTVPRWLELYSKPFDWLVEHTPLKMPLRRYADWCYHSIWGW